MYLSDLEADPQGPPPPATPPTTALPVTPPPAAPATEDFFTQFGGQRVAQPTPPAAPPSPASEDFFTSVGGTPVASGPRVGGAGMTGSSVQKTPGGPWEWMSAEEDGPQKMVKAIWTHVNPVTFAKAMTVGTAQLLIDLPAAFADVAFDLVDLDVAGLHDNRKRIEGILGGSLPVAQGAADAFTRGDYVTGVRKTANFFVPILGPVLDGVADKYAAGQSWEATGDMIGLALVNILGPKALSKVPLRVPAVLRNRNTQQAAAAEFAARHKMPITAGQASGSEVARGVEEVAGYSPVGLLTDPKYKAGQSAAIERVGAEMATRVAPRAETSLTAGQSVPRGVQATLKRHNRNADRGYAKWRQIANDPANVETVQVGMREVAVEVPNPNAMTSTATPLTVTRPVPVMADVALPVNLGPIKQNPTLRAIWLKIKNDPARLARAQVSEAFNALDDIMSNLRDFEPATYVDDNLLSPLKKMARGGLPELRGQEQGIAAAAVSALEKEFQKAVAKAGPEAQGALTAARAATKAKRTIEKQTYDALQNQLKDLPKEPASIFEALTSHGDANIMQLKRVAEAAPGSIPKLARAWLDKALSKAVETGELTRADGVWRDWMNLGPETKRVLFGVDQADLHSFFLSAKMASRSVNKSKTALVATITTGGSFTYMFTNPWVTVPTYIAWNALGPLLRAPRVVKLLTKGLNTPITNAGAAALLAELTKVALEANAPPPQPAPPAQAPKR